MKDARKDLAAAFLRRHGWADARRSFLAGDASDRTYDRLWRSNDSAVLMDAPPGKGDDPRVFVIVAQHLRDIGLSAPQVLAHDFAAGFVLLEDFGDASFASVLRVNEALEALLYTTATDAILALQSGPKMPELTDLSASDWANAAMMAFDWYGSGITGAPSDVVAPRNALTDAIAAFADGPRVMIHRDYHAENLMWLPDRTDHARAGILDFQLLQMGQPVYDLVSLLQDARRDVSSATVRDMQSRFCTASEMPRAEFDLAFAVFGAQRALRIIGIFARLCLVAGKAQYLPMIPRVWGHLQSNLSHPALAQLCALCLERLPPPSATNLAILRDKCGSMTG